MSVLRSQWRCAIATRHPVVARAADLYRRSWTCSSTRRQLHESKKRPAQVLSDASAASASTDVPSKPYSELTLGVPREVLSGERRVAVSIAIVEGHSTRLNDCLLLHDALLDPSRQRQEAPLERFQECLSRAFCGCRSAILRCRLPIGRRKACRCTIYMVRVRYCTQGPPAITFRRQYQCHAIGFYVDFAALSSSTQKQGCYRRSRKTGRQFIRDGHDTANIARASFRCTLVNGKYSGL